MGPASLPEAAAQAMLHCGKPSRAADAACRYTRACNLLAWRSIPVQTPPKAPAMTRLLLALCLCLVATAALADDAAPAAAESPVCLKPETKTGKPADAGSRAPAAQPGAPAPVRARGTSRGGPRWHSMLPGMIR
jgi:hypothetical protein